MSDQKRRSNRVVKRKKYTEDLDIKITDDEDEQEDVDVITTAAAVASISGGTVAQLKPEVELDVDGQPSMQFFVVSVRLVGFALRRNSQADGLYHLKLNFFYGCVEAAF